MKLRPFARYILLLLVCLITIFGYHLYLYSFRLSNISTEGINAEKESSYFIPTVIDQTVLSIINQRFTYLGEGNQVYAFESKDDQYVLKFFKFGHLKANFWDDWLPAQTLQKLKHRRERKVERIFNAYTLAYQIDPASTGLLYAHMKPTTDELPTIQVYDQFQLKHSIPLDDVVFALQKKGTPLNTLVKKALSNGDTLKAQKLLGQILDMYMTEYALGICDLDYNLWHNTGFVGETPIRIDVGKIIKDAKYTHPEIYMKDLEKVHHRIDRWLDHYYPQYKKEIMDYCTTHIQA